MKRAPSTGNVSEDGGLNFGGLLNYFCGDTRKIANDILVHGQFSIE
jgi:hypothetical protein